MKLLSKTPDSQQDMHRKDTSDTERDLLSSPETTTSRSSNTLLHSSKGAHATKVLAAVDGTAAGSSGHATWTSGHAANAAVTADDRYETANIFAPIDNRQPSQPPTALSTAMAAFQREGEWLEQQEELDMAVAVYKKCLACRNIANDKSTQTMIQLGNIHHSIGRLQWKRGDYKDCLLHYDRAIAHYENHEMSTLDVADAFIDKGLAHVSQGDLAMAKHCFRCAKASRSGDCVRSQLLEGRTLHGFALVHEANGTLDRALSYCHDALDWLKQGQREASICAANTLLTLGSIYEKQKIFEFSLGCYEEAYTIYSEYRGSVADLGSALAHIGWVHYRQARYSQAIAMYKQALQTIRSLGRNSRNVATILVQLGLARAQKGQLRKARLHLQRALSIQTQLLGGHHPDVATTLAAMSKVATTDIHESFGLLDRAFHIRLATLGNQHVVVGVTLVQLGRLYSRLHFDDSSARCYVDALMIFRNKGLSRSDDRVAEAEFLLKEKQRAFVKQMSSNSNCEPHFVMRGNAHLCTSNIV